jgi:hypothetical protein
MNFKSIFSRESSNDTNTINGVLKKGAQLEDNGKVLDAYFLYRGLVAAYPDCKACRAHMGITKTKLTHQGIHISITDTNAESASLGKK